MLKKLCFSFLMIVIICLCVISIIFMYKSNRIYDVTFDNNLLESLAADLSDAYTVSKGNVIMKVAIKGIVVPNNEEALTFQTIEANKKDVQILVKAGQVVRKDDTIASYKTKTLKASNLMKCISIQSKDGEITIIFLDYSKLYIEANIPVNYINDNLYLKDVQILCNNNTFVGSIQYLDYVCIDNKVSSKINYENEKVLLMPGMNCKISMVIDEKKGVIIVPLEYIIYIKEEDKYQVQIVQGNESFTKNIEVGLIGEDNAQIISGLCVNDKILYPREEKSLRYYLNNYHQEQE